MAILALALLLSVALAHGEPVVVGPSDVVLPTSATIGGLSTTSEVTTSPRGRLIAQDDLDRAGASSRPAFLLTIDRTGALWGRRPTEGKVGGSFQQILYPEVQGAITNWWAGQPTSVTKGGSLDSANLILRADSRARWLSVLWTLLGATDPKIRIHRLFLAVQGADGRREGYLALFLPRALTVVDMGGDAATGPTIGAQFRAGGKPWSTPATVYAISSLLEGVTGVRRARSQLEIAHSELASVGEVVRLMDCALRAGITQLALVGDVPDLPKSTEEVMRALREGSGGNGESQTAPSLWVNGHEVNDAPKDFELPPPAPQIQGVAAGSVYMDESIEGDR